MSAGDRQQKRQERGKAAAGVRREKEDRDGAHFVALPFDVLRSPGYRGLSHTARSLLIDVCCQDPRFRNGRLVVTAKALQPLGWRSEGTMRRALQELVDGGLLVMTRQGGRQVSSWFAVTWRGLDLSEGLDLDARAWNTTYRGAYRRAADAGNRAPSEGAQTPVRAPSEGVPRPVIAPSERAVEAQNGTFGTPSEGEYLERSHLPQLGSEEAGPATLAPTAPAPDPIQHHCTAVRRSDTAAASIA